MRAKQYNGHRNPTRKEATKSYISPPPFLGNAMKKAEDFSEWYNEIVEKANLTDKRYPIKGMNV